MPRGATAQYNLQIKFPEIAKELLVVDPMTLTPGASREKYLWQCQKVKGHVYSARVRDRTRGSGCPHCVRNAPASAEKNLAVLYPDIARQLANPGDDPYKISPGSERRCLWKCEHGHTWPAQVYSRTKLGTGCPYCCGLKSSPDYNLRNVFPEIAAELSEEDPTRITPKSNRNLPWLCRKCGHRWKATVVNRTQNGSGCPKCFSSRRVSFFDMRLCAELRAMDVGEVRLQDRTHGKEIDVYLPQLKLGIEHDGVQWHKKYKDKSAVDQAKTKFFEARGITIYRVREEGLDRLSPTDVFRDPNSREHLSTIKELFRVLLAAGRIPAVQIAGFKQYLTRTSYLNEAGYAELETEYKSGLAGRMSVAEKCPNLISEWSEANNLRADQVPFGSPRIVEWKCLKGLGHRDFKSMVSNRTTKGQGCPLCGKIRSAEKRRSRVKVSVMEKCPKLVVEWSSRNRRKSHEVNYGTHDKAWWVCSIHGEYEMIIANRTIKGRGCPHCSRLTLGAKISAAKRMKMLQ